MFYTYQNLFRPVNNAKRIFFSSLSIAMTSAERKRKERERKKSLDPDYQAKENKRIEQLRKKKFSLMNETEKEKKRMKSRDSSRLYRLKKKKM